MLRFLIDGHLFCTKYNQFHLQLNQYLCLTCHTIIAHHLPFHVLCLLSLACSVSILLKKVKIVVWGVYKNQTRYYDLFTVFFLCDNTKI